MREAFHRDLQTIYDYISARNKRLGEYYKAALSKGEVKKRDELDSFLALVGLEPGDENRLAAATRLVDLREDALTQAIKASGGNDAQVQRGKEVGYDWVSAFYLDEHEELLHFIDKKELLTSFYRKLLWGVHETGRAFGNLHISWNAHIINGINPELLRLCEGDEARIFAKLRDEQLMDKGHGGVEADRCYSALVKTSRGYVAKAYSDVFEEEVRSVVDALDGLIAGLKKETDEVFGQEGPYIAYFEAIQEALKEKDRHHLVERWAEVDRRWMQVTAPLQVGHPLEYYEDHYRKAVAIEWDVRMVNPAKEDSREVEEGIRTMFDTLFEEVDGQKRAVKERVMENIGRVQLYIGQPMFFYGSEFCGLFSAQVVPNDEIVTKESGKKIFAFSDRVLDSIRNKPRMKIDTLTFTKEFLDKEHDLIFKRPDDWHKVYEITTIGHEYGHVLWLDNDTESVMNQGGNYKNIEEFKATTGGLVSFFLNDELVEAYWEDVMIDTVKRAVKLIAWMQVPEVLPYYCEGLIHLEGMFASGVLMVEQEHLHVDLSEAAFKRMREWYLQTYKELAAHYLAKADASEFLFRYTRKEHGFFKPRNPAIDAFVDHYYHLYQTIGRVAAEE